jgi:uncharacterized protein YggE
MANKWNLFVGTVIVLLLAGVLVVQLTGVSPVRAAFDTTQKPARVITVVGQGTSSAQPDLAYANLGTQFVAPTLTEATQESNDTMTAVIAKLKELGVADEDIQTTNYSILPQQDYQNGTPGPITGYQVSNTVRVTIRDLTKIGTILDQATQAGANNVFGVTFALNDPDQLQREAYDMALRHAQERAADLTKAGGVQLGDLLSITQSSTSNPGPVVEAAVGRGAGGTPIQSGTLEVQVQVQLIYAIH